MTDVFERPAIHVSQSARPRIATTPSIIRVSDEGKHSRQNSAPTGGKQTRDSRSALRAALATLRSSQAAEVRAVRHSITGAFAQRRTSASDQIAAEYAYKISAALMGALVRDHSAIVGALKAEQAAKTAAVLAAVASEEQQAIAAALAPLRARHSQERKQMSAKWTPSRPGQRSSVRFSVLKTP